MTPLQLAGSEGLGRADYNEWWTNLKQLLMRNLCCCNGRSDTEVE